MNLGFLEATGLMSALDGAALGRRYAAPLRTAAATASMALVLLPA